MSVSDRLHRVESKRRSVLAAAAALTPAQLAARPAPNSWSALEIVEHLVLAEQAVLGDLESSPRRAAQRRALSDYLRYAVVLVVLRFGIRVAVPPEAMRPSGAQSLSALVAQWNAQHQSLRVFVAGLDRNGQRRAIFRHPVAGPLDVSQVLTMLDAHLGTHLRQLRRVSRRSHPLGN